MKRAADNKERNWHHWRARYTVAGASIDSRPKRPGLAWQELRASVALFLEWFRLSLRHGWLGSYRKKNREQAVPINRAEKALRGMLNKRRRIGLDLPYGSAAVRAGVALHGTGPPKSDRPPRVKVDRGEIPF